MPHRQVMRFLLSLIVLVIFVIAVGDNPVTENNKPTAVTKNNPKSPRTIGINFSQRPLYRLQNQTQDINKQFDTERTQIKQFYADRIAEVTERYNMEMAKLKEEEAEIVRHRYSLREQIKRGLSHNDVKFKMDRISSAVKRVKAAKREAYDDYTRDRRYFEVRRANELKELEERSE